jgi:hypothetical protein
LDSRKCFTWNCMSRANNVLPSFLSRFGLGTQRPQLTRSGNPRLF